MYQEPFARRLLLGAAKVANRALPAHRQPNTVIAETSLARGTLKNIEIIEDTRQTVRARSGT